MSCSFAQSRMKDLSHSVPFCKSILHRNCYNGSFRQNCRRHCSQKCFCFLVQVTVSTNKYWRAYGLLNVSNPEWIVSMILDINCKDCLVQKASSEYLRQTHGWKCTYCWSAEFSGAQKLQHHLHKCSKSGGEGMA